MKMKVEICITIPRVISYNAQKWDLPIFHSVDSLIDLIHYIHRTENGKSHLSAMHINECFLVVFKGTRYFICIVNRNLPSARKVNIST